VDATYLSQQVVAVSSCSCERSKQLLDVTLNYSVLRNVSLASHSRVLKSFLYIWV